MNQNDQSNQQQLPRYKCHKEVWALKIDAIHLDSDVAKSEGRETTGGAFIYPEDKSFAPFTVDADYMTKHKPEAGGYYVVYMDGYKSFSPAKAFEDGYSFILPSPLHFSVSNDGLIVCDQDGEIKGDRLFKIAQNVNSIYNMLAR